MCNAVSTKTYSDTMTIGLKLVNYLLIYPIQSILPICATYTAWRLLYCRRVRSNRKLPSSSFLSWFMHRSMRQLLRLFIQIELFTAIYYVIRKQMLQYKPLVPQRHQTTIERRTLAARCLNSIEEMDFENTEEEEKQGITGATTTDVVAQHTTPSERKAELKRASISGWFFGAPLSSIRRGNLEQWVCWAFFLKRRRDIQPKSKEMIEVDYLVNEIIDWADLTTSLKPGFNNNVKCIRLDFDPIPSTYRPFIYYLVTYGFVGIATEIIMRWYGFVKHTSGCLTYWYRPPDTNNNTTNNSEDKPIVFCHGLGIGVLSYVTLVNELLSNSKQRSNSLFMVELPHISMRPVEVQASPRELVTCIEDLLAAHCHQTAHFVGHSFGTLVLTWVAKHSPKIVSKFTFLDPVCFLLCKHDVAFNFLYKKPTNASEALMSYFVGQELFIAYTLSRRFQWQANILWPEQIAHVPSTVCLSSLDHIVPSSAVKRHLMSWKQNSNAKNGNTEGRNENKQLNVITFDGIGHAGFLLNSKSQTQVVNIITNSN